MQPANRREVDRDAWPERLKSDDANWWIETEVGWSWSLWASDRDDFALNVVWIRWHLGGVGRAGPQKPLPTSTAHVA